LGRALKTFLRTIGRSKKKKRSLICRSRFAERKPTNPLPPKEGTREMSKRANPTEGIINHT